MRRKRKRGLTIIELLVAIGVLVILLTLTAFIVGPTQLKKARDARRKSDLDRIKIALYDYYFDHECFPEEDGLPGCGENFGADGDPYLKNFPCDPYYKTPYVYTVRQGGGKCKQWFRIFTNLENTDDSIIDQIHCRTGCGPDRNTCFYNYGVASTNTQIYRNCADAVVCNPGGVCEKFEDPWTSGCPITFDDLNECKDSGLCSNPENQCKNASGKHIPWE